MANSAAATGLALTAEQAVLWRSLIEARIGMVLPERQYPLFERRVLAAMHSTKLAADAYYALVCRDRQAWQCLAESLLVHETAFFRHPPSFELVARYLSQQPPASEKVLRLWSVGCSTGEEAWSLAMVTATYAPQDFQIVATDMSESALRVARSGCYAPRKLAGLSDACRQEFGEFLPEGQWQVGARLMRHVSFYLFNLMQVNRVPFRRVDVIFCQNVLIYFRKFDRRDILDALVQRLELGGLLILAPGEMADWQHAQMRRVDHAGTLAYERILT